MPFDFMPSNGLHNLYALRDRLLQALPPDFTWDYGYVLRKNDCGSAGCALGLAFETMPAFKALIDQQGIHSEFGTAALFGINQTEFNFIFLFVPVGRAVEEITPAEVAARIDQVLLARDRKALVHTSASGERRVGGLVPA